jgi:hypothetical protein
MKISSTISAAVVVALAELSSAATWQEWSGANCSGSPFFNGGSCGGSQAQCVSIEGSSVDFQSSFGVPCSIPFFNDTTCGASGGSELFSVGPGGCVNFANSPGVGSFSFACFT